MDRSEVKTDMKISQRLDWLDVLKALAMFLVVYGHTSRDNTPDTVRYYIYSFHMPLFFMISGMGFYMQLKHRSYTVLSMTKNKLRTLMWPYLAFNILAIPLWHLANRVFFQASETYPELILAIGYSNQKWNSLPSSTTWFLPVVFLALLMFYLIYRYSRDEQQIVIFSLLSGLFAYAMSLNSKDKFFYPWHLDTVPMACFLIMLGYVFMAHHDQIKSFLEKSPARQIICLILCLAAGYFSAKNNIKISMAVNSYGSFLLCMIAILAFSFACYIVSTWIPALGVIKLIGRNTIVYLAFHEKILQIAARASSRLDAFTDKYSLIMAIIVFVLLIPVSWAIEKFFPVLLGKKKRKYNY